MLLCQFLVQIIIVIYFFKFTYIMNINETMFLSILQVLGVHMSSREAAKMGDILATEADLLGMIMEVTNLKNDTEQ